MKHSPASMYAAWRLCTSPLAYALLGRAHAGLSHRCGIHGVHSTLIEVLRWPHALWIMLGLVPWLSSMLRLPFASRQRHGRCES
eukprot:3634827-Amphidinium_carterae.2